MEDNWDLHAVVRACYKTTMTTKNTCKITFGSNLDSPSNDNNNHHLNFFVNPFDNLHEFYKPHLSPQNTPISSSLASLFASNQQSRVFQQQQQLKRPYNFTTKSTAAPNLVLPRSKRGKNPVKRVYHVAANAVPSDIWTWRKYGQKIIKDSPYPRGYYRCSNSNGCLARKQVERHKSNPSMFVVTYTAEHNHAAPINRNSFASSTRKIPQTTITSYIDKQRLDEELACQSQIEKKSKSFDDEPVLSNMAVIEDDFFEGLEDFALWTPKSV